MCVNVCVCVRARLNIYEPTRGVMVKAMDCGIVVSEFEFQSYFFVHFWIRELFTLGKSINSLILSALG